MDDCIIPPKSEGIVYAMIDRPEIEFELQSQTYLVKANPVFEYKNSVVVAVALVDSKDRLSVPVRILNTSIKDIHLSQNEVVGQAELYTDAELQNLQIAEDEDHNFYSIRKINLEGPPKFPKEYDHKEEKFEQTSTEILSNIPPYLKDLYLKAVRDRDLTVKAAVIETLRQHSDVFSKDDQDLGRTNLVEHNINSGDSRPRRQAQPPCKVPLAFESEERKVIETMQKQGIIQKSTPPWASPIVLIKKKNGKVRPCIDYRRLNAVTIPNAFPLPRVQDCLDAVRGSIY